MTHSTCNYTIAPLSDSVPTECGKTAIRRVIIPDGKQTEMLYCYVHWQGVRDIKIVQDGAIEDLTDEEC